MLNNDTQSTPRAGESPDDAARPHERGFHEAFFGSSTDYPYAGVASEHRRGRFGGRGPKGYRRSDERIREEISDRLMVHPDIDASDIEISVTNGVVMLSGTVEDRHEKRLAEYIAEDSAGVDDVDNRLKVHHHFWTSHSHDSASDRELPRQAMRDHGVASSEGGRANAARNAARRDLEGI